MDIAEHVPGISTNAITKYNKKVTTCIKHQATAAAAMDALETASVVSDAASVASKKSGSSSRKSLAPAPAPKAAAAKKAEPKAEAAPESKAARTPTCPCVMSYCVTAREYKA